MSEQNGKERPVAEIRATSDSIAEREPVLVMAKDGLAAIDEGLHTPYVEQLFHQMIFESRHGAHPTVLHFVGYSTACHATTFFLAQSWQRIRSCDAQ